MYSKLQTNVFMEVRKTAAHDHKSNADGLLGLFRPVFSPFHCKVTPRIKITKS